MRVFLTPKKKKKHVSKKPLSAHLSRDETQIVQAAVDLNPGWGVAKSQSVGHTDSFTHGDITPIWASPADRSHLPVRSVFPSGHTNCGW